MLETALVGVRRLSIIDFDRQTENGAGVVSPENIPRTKS